MKKKTETEKYDFSAHYLDKAAFGFDTSEEVWVNLSRDQGTPFWVKGHIAVMEVSRMGKPPEDPEMSIEYTWKGKKICERWFYKRHLRKIDDDPHKPEPPSEQLTLF